MKRSRILTTFFLALLQSPVALSDGAGTKVFAQNSASIVKVEHGWPRTDTQGSGVVIAENLVVTNCHVIREATRIYVTSAKAKTVAGLQHAELERDLCLLFVPDLSAPPILQIAHTVPPHGTKVFAIGAPLGLDLTLSEGIVSSLRNTRSGPVIQTTAAISPGSSGGGLFDETGALVGITTAQIRQGQNLNFAVPLDRLRRWLEAYHVARRAAKLAVGEFRNPPNAEVLLSRETHTDGLNLASSARHVGNAIRLTPKHVATVCSAIGVTSWPARPRGIYILRTGKYFTPMRADWLVFADVGSNICIGESNVEDGETASAITAKSGAVRIGEPVFGFADPALGRALDLGIVEESYPAEPGYGHVFAIRSNPPLRLGSGVFMRDGQLVGIVSRRTKDGLAVLASIETLRLALEQATSPIARPAKMRRH